MRVSRRVIILSAGATALKSALPLRHSFADSKIKEYRLTVDFYQDLAYKLIDLVYDHGKPIRDHPPEPPTLPANPLPEPDLAAGERHEIALQGGTMGGMGMMGMGGATWAMNGT